MKRNSGEKMAVLLFLYDNCLLML